MSKKIAEQTENNIQDLATELGNIYLEFRTGKISRGEYNRKKTEIQTELKNLRKTPEWLISYDRGFERLKRER